MSRIPVGLQMYTLRDLSATDFVGTLEKVSKLGYAGVELAGTFGLSAAELKKHLDRLNLKALGSHIGMGNLDDLEKTAEFYNTLGTKYLVLPWLDESQRQTPEQWKALLKKVAVWGAALRQRGFTFCYHNHDFEFKKIDGQYILDYIYASIPAADLSAELDLFWVKKGGEDPLAYARKYKGRLPLVHVKDMTADGKFASVGSGVLDFKPFFAEAAGLGVKWYIVEQDSTYELPPLDAVRNSIEYLKKIGIA